MSEELIECPFCSDKNIGIGSDGNGGWYIDCGRKHIVHFLRCAKEDAIQRWNTRHAEDALKAENRELRRHCRWRKNLLLQCAKLSRLCFPKKDYSKESLFKIINQIYMLVSATDDAPDTEKGCKDE